MFDLKPNYPTTKADEAKLHDFALTTQCEDYYVSSIDHRITACRAEVCRCWLSLTEKDASHDDA